MADLAYGVFIAGPLIALGARVPSGGLLAAGSLLFLLLSAGLGVVIAVVSESSTAGVWIPTIAVIQYLVLLALIAVRTVRHVATSPKK